MIVLFNSKITDDRLWHYHRYNLQFSDRLDVAKYCFASFAPLADLVSAFVFYLDLAEFAHRQQELQDWIESVLPKEKVLIHWHRINSITEWREVGEQLAATDYDLILPAASWEDHIFWDSSTSVLEQGMDLILADPAFNATLPISHYPEQMRYAYSRTPTVGQLTDCGNYVIYTTPDDQPHRIMKRSFFEHYLAQPHDPNKMLYRIEQFFQIPGEINRLYQPTKEILRHFDGYSNIEMGGDVCPPLAIPPGFFDCNITIKYGFDNYDPAAVNINPLKQLRIIDPVNGTDYRFSLEDIPLFWKPFIKNIEIADGVNLQTLRQARNDYFKEMIKIDCVTAHGIFNQSTKVPESWIANHMLPLDKQ